jgi:hypothetical protein
MNLVMGRNQRKKLSDFPQTLSFSGQLPRLGKLAGIETANCRLSIYLLFPRLTRPMILWICLGNQNHKHMVRGGHGLPKVLQGPTALPFYALQGTTCELALKPPQG